MVHGRCEGPMCAKLRGSKMVKIFQEIKLLELSNNLEILDYFSMWQIKH